MPEFAHDEKVIFLTALQHDVASEREAYLRGACGDNPDVLKRVKALLTVHEESRGPLDEPVPGVIRGLAGELPAGEGPGTVIGPYKLLEQIGEGGFGLVFMAEQQQPLRRKVAVKIIKPGMDSRQVIARFEAERQALALMDHPNIARVLDAGNTGGGRPYFAMELVRGIPITDYCDEHKLTPRARLELFGSVCQAVLHAHQKGIIHRDIKPSNVLVTLHDGVPVVKVIDFGIAKALGQQLTDKTLFTGYAQLLGTPLYMSPEQAELSGLDIDTRSDIYSLGVLLYELLTGMTPFDKKRLREVDYDEMRRIIREEEPSKPSTRMNTLGQAGTTVSARRQSDPKRLSQLFRGELDWIVMKALEKDRNRRYDTVKGMALDVDRYLRDEPVEACPPSSWYRLSKVVRRHRWPLALFAVAALSLLVIAVGSLISSLYLSKALRDAENNRVRAEEAEHSAKESETAAKESETTARESETAAGKAERAARGRLFESLVAQARASRLSHRMGQRFTSLDTLADAARIARSLNTIPAHALELRNEVIACLALADVRVAKEWAGWPDGSMLAEFDGGLERYARTDRQGFVHIHRVADGAELWRLPDFGPGDFGNATHPYLSPDGRFLLLERGKAVKLWSLAGQAPAPIELDRAVCTASAFSLDSRELILAHADGSIHLHDLPSGRERKQVKGVPNSRCLAPHPTARQLAIGHANGVQILDLDTGAVLAELAQPTDRCIAWRPDGKALAVAGFDRLVHLWDVAAHKPIAQMEGRPIPGLSLAFNHSGDVLAGGGGWDTLLHLWDARTGAQLFSTEAVIHTIRFSPDDKLLAVQVGADENKLKLLQVALPSGYTLTGNPIQPGGMAASPKDRLLALGMKEGVGLWDLQNGTLLTVLESAGSSVAFEPSGALFTSGSGGLLRWPIHGDAAVPGLLRIGPAQKLPFDRTEKIVASADGLVLAGASTFVTGSCGQVWHRDRPGPPLPLPYHYDSRYIDISPDGRWVATGSHFGAKVIVSSARTGEQCHELPVEDGSRIHFSPDSRWLATTGGGCRLWAVDSWREGRYIGGSDLAFSPDGKLMAVETGHGVVRLVDPETGRELAQLEDPNQDRSTHLCFSRDGTQLVAVGDNSLMRIWDLRLIRRQLAALDLDWELPPYPPAAARADGAPLQVRVEYGEVLNRPRAKTMNGDAWKLATDPEAKSRDPRRAVELAEEAVRLTPDEGLYWNTLGVAHYRAGHWDESIRALDKSMQLMAGKFESFDTFFLAMAHWQLNDRDRARKWYAQAVTWLEKNQAKLIPQHVQELRQFQVEAATLLDYLKPKE